MPAIDPKNLPPLTLGEDTIRFGAREVRTRMPPLRHRLAWKLCHQSFDSDYDGDFPLVTFAAAGLCCEGFPEIRRREEMLDYGERVAGWLEEQGLGLDDIALYNACTEIVSRGMLPLFVVVAPDGTVRPGPDAPPSTEAVERLGNGSGPRRAGETSGGCASDISSSETRSAASG